MKSKTYKVSRRPVTLGTKLFKPGVEFTLAPSERSNYIEACDHLVACGELILVRSSGYEEAPEPEVDEDEELAELAAELEALDDE